MSYPFGECNDEIVETLRYLEIIVKKLGKLTP
jgi:hypothetical protein